MKTLLIYLCPLWTWAQISIADSFSDGDFTSGTTWAGSDSLFEVKSRRLNLNANSSGRAFLSTPSTISQSAEWQFEVHLDFNPSSSNFAKVYLISDNPDLNDPLNGYFVRVGGDRDDRLGLFRQSGRNTYPIASSAADYLDLQEVELRVLIKRDSTGLWTLRSDTGNVPDPPVLHGSGRDTAFNRSLFFGLSCTYTVTRSDKFSFDDFALDGEAYTDRTPPAADTLYAAKSTVLKLRLSEAADSSAADTTGYTLLQGNKRPYLVNVDEKDLSLYFTDKFLPRKKYELAVKGLKDIAGNPMSDTMDFEVYDPEPFLYLAYPFDSSDVELLFSKEVDSASLMLSSGFLLNGHYRPDSLEKKGRDGRRILLHFRDSAFNREYNDLGISVQDLFGHDLRDTVSFLQPETGWKDNFTGLLPDVSWTGERNDFETGEEGNLKLHSEGEGISYLARESRIFNNACWFFAVKLDFNPSSSNYARFYCTSDTRDLSGPLNGYFVQVGGAEDRIGLYRQSGGSITPVVESRTGLLDHSVVEARVMVSRNAGGTWVLSLDTGNVPQALRGVGSETDTVHSGSFFSGPYAKYTSTRSDKITFDNIYLWGHSHIDTAGPFTDSLVVLNDSVLQITFSETVAEVSVGDISNYQLGERRVLPLSARLIRENRRTVQLTFREEFAPRVLYSLRITGIEDLYGNRAEDTVSFLWYVPGSEDVIINEIMADPDPVIGNTARALPEKEFLEFYNRAAIDVNLTDWVLEVSGRKYEFPSYELRSGAYVVVTAMEAVQEFVQRGIPAVGIDISGTALTNTGTSVILYSSSGEVLSAINYEEGWYDDPDKSGGGWTLERIDPANLCSGRSNWRASLSRSGGTPAAKNSVHAEYKDTAAPVVKRIALPADTVVRLHLSGFIDPDSLLSPDTFHFSPFLPVEKILPDSITFHSVDLVLREALRRDTIYSLWLRKGPKGCNGRRLRTDTFFFALPSVPAPGDILINEILFDPYPGGSDFVELYNNSGKFFDLEDLRLANYEPSAERAVNVEVICEDSYLFGPGSYIALSSKLSALKSFYRVKEPENLLQTPGTLPSMPDDKGNIALSMPDLRVVDYFIYDDDYHLPFFSDKEGISLERISTMEDRSAHNWQSAAATAGFATPGYKNSHDLKPKVSSEVIVSPKVFSPDQDGHKDVVSLQYHFDKPNYILSVHIRNALGKKVKELVNSASIAQEGFVKWDGTNEKGALENSGIYIVIFDFFHEDGNRGRIRETCVLSL